MEAEGGDRRSERKATPVEAKRIKVAPSRKPARSRTRSLVKRGKAGKAAAGASVGIEAESEAGAMLADDGYCALVDGGGGRRRRRPAG